MRFINFIINFVRNLLTINFNYGLNYIQCYVEVSSIGGIFYLEDYMRMSAYIPYTSRVIINLSDWVLHLFHAPKKLAKYVFNYYMPTTVTRAPEIVTPVFEVKVPVVVEVIGTLDVVHHGNIYDPIVAVKLEKKEEKKEINSNKYKTIKKLADLELNAEYYSCKYWNLGGYTVVYKDNKGKIVVTDMLWPRMTGWDTKVSYTIMVRKGKKEAYNQNTIQLDRDELIELQLTKEEKRNIPSWVGSKKHRKTDLRKMMKKAKPSWKLATYFDIKPIQEVSVHKVVLIDYTLVVDQEEFTFKSRTRALRIFQLTAGRLGDDRLTLDSGIIS